MASVNLGDAQGRITLDTSGFERGMTSVLSSLNSMTAQIQQVGSTLSSMNQTLEGMASAANQPAQQLSALSRALETVRTGLHDFNNSSNDMATRLRGLSDAAVTVGSSMTEHISKPLFEVGQSCVTMAMEFESQMDRVGSISGATGEELQRLTDYAQEMGAKTMFSSQQCGEAMEYMAMAGWSVDEVISGLPGVLSLAAIGQTELATASDIVTDALTAFGESADQSGRLANIMAATITSANTDVEKLGQTFKYVAPVAGAAGYTMEETATMIGLMGNAGIKASQAGTSLRATISRLTTQSGEAGDAMEALGISITKEDGNMISLTDTMNMLRDKLHGLTEEQQVAYAKQLAGMTAFSGLLGIINATDEAYASLTAETQAANYVTEENKETVDALALAMGMSMTNTNDMEDALASLGIELRNTDGEFGNLIDFTTRLKGQWGDLTTEQKAYFAEALVGKDNLEQFNEVMNMTDKEFDKFIQSLGEAGGLADVVANQMMDNLKGKLLLLESATQNAAIAFGTLMIPVIEKVVEALTTFVVWVNNLDESQKKLVVTIAAVVAAIGPLLTVFGKLLSFGVDVYTNLGRMKDILKEVGTTASNAVSGGLNLFISVLSKLKDIALHPIQNLKQLGSSIKELVTAFTNLNAPMKILIVTVSLLSAAWATNFGNIRGVVKEFVSEHKESIAQVVELITNLLGIVVTIGAAIAKAWSKLKDDCGESFAAISKAFEAILEAISFVLGGIIDVIGRIAEAINGFFDWLHGKAGQAEDTGKSLGESMADGWDSGTQRLEENGKNTLERAMSAWKESGTSEGLETGTEIGESLSNATISATEAGLDKVGTGITDKITEGVEEAKEPSKAHMIELGKVLTEGIEIGTADLSNVVYTSTADEMIAGFQKAGVDVTMVGKDTMKNAAGEIVAVWNDEIKQWVMTDAGLIATGLAEQAPRVAESMDAIAEAIGDSAPALQREGNNCIIAATGEIVATWNEEMGKWQITAPEKIVNGIYAAEEQSRQAAETLAKYTLDGYITAWDYKQAEADGKLDELIAAIEAAYPGAFDAGSEIGMGAIEGYERELSKFSTSNSVTVAMVEPFEKAGIEVKTKAGNIINEATNEVLVQWNAGMNKFELTEAGKLALIIAEQEKNIKSAAEDDILAANAGVATQWAALIAEAGVLFPQLPQELNNQTQPSTEAGENNIQGYSSGVQGTWNTTVSPWLAGRGPEIGTALNKGTAPATSAGSAVMGGFHSGLQSRWASIASWVSEKVSWIATKLSLALAGFGAGGSSGAKGASVASAAMMQVAEAVTASIETPMMMALGRATTNVGAMAVDSAARVGDAMAVFTSSTSSSTSAAENNTLTMKEVLETFFELLTKFFDQIAQEIDDFNEKSVEKQQEQIDKMVKPVKLMFEALEEVYTNGFKKLQEIMEKGFDWTIIEETADTTKTTFRDIVEKYAHVFGEMDDILQSTIGAIDETWSKGWSYITDDFVNNVEEINTAWKEGLETLAKNAKEGLDNLKKATGMSLQEISMLNQTYGTQVGSTWGNLTEIISGLKEAAGDDSLLEAIKNLGDKVLKMKGNWLDACDAIDMWIEKGPDIVENANITSEEIEKPTEAFEKISSTWKTIGESAETLASGLSTLADKLFAVELTLGEILRQFGSYEENTELSEKATKELAAAFKNQFDKIKESVEELEKVFGESKEDIGNAATEFFTVVTDAMFDEWNRWLAWFRKPDPDNNIAQMVKDLESWWARLKQAGKLFMNQFTEGMREHWNSVTKPMFESWISYMIDRLDRMRETLRQMKAVQAEAERVAAAIAAANAVQPDGSHEMGLGYVPFDGYIAELHAGERVLTKKEAQEYRNEQVSSSKGDTYVFNSPKAIDAREAARLMKQMKRDILGGFA